MACMHGTIVRGWTLAGCHFGSAARNRGYALLPITEIFHCEVTAADVLQPAG